MRSSSSSSASSSTSSDTDERTTTTTRLRAPSEISRDTQQSGSRYDAASATNTINRTSIVETATIQSSSPALSYSSAVATGTPYDTISLATTTNTGFTSNAASQQHLSGSIPVIAPPALEQQRIGIDVVSAHQQYQQRAVPPEMSPFSGSTVSSTSGSLSSPGSTSVRQQPRVDIANATVNPVDNTREQPQQGYTTNGQFQFPNQIPIQQAYNEPDEYKDVVLNIDYGAMEAYNIALQSDEFTGGQQPSNMPANEPRFDVAKAIFNQVDTNHDGRISREEFQRWAQGNQQHVGSEQTFSHAHTNNYETTMGNNNDHTQLFAGATPDIANILQQSGLGQAFGNFR